LSGASNSKPSSKPSNALNGERLSSASTFFVKRVLPVLWFGGLLYFAANSAFAGDIGAYWPFVLAPVAIIAITYYAFRAMIWRLADDVTLVDGALLVRQRGRDYRIALGDVVDVPFTRFSNPSYLSLRLRDGHTYGDHVYFMPRAQFTLNLFAPNDVRNTLRLAIERAAADEHIPEQASEHAP
jgi:hypothetical protein